jgi:hypothetical protein
MDPNQNNFNALGPKPEFSTQPGEPDDMNQYDSQQSSEPVQQPMYQQPMQQPMYQQYQQPMQQPMYQQYEQYDNSDYDDAPKKNNLWMFILLGVVGLLVIIGIVVLVTNKGKKDKPVEEPTTEETVTFEGEGYKFEHGKSWAEGKNGDLKALRSGDNNTTLLALTTSTLSDNVDCSFEDEACQSKVYNMFYEIWISQLSNESLSLFKNDTVFEEFKDDIYIAYFNYGKNSTRLKGRYIILISEDKNAIVTFRYSTEDDVEDIYKKVTKMLSTIEIEEQTGGINNPSIGEYLDKLSSWNRSTEMRNGLTLSKERTLTGGWVLLADNPTYWKFEGNKFYWYQSPDVLDNNYWEGTFTFKTGKEGLESVGLEGSKMDIITNNSAGTVTEADVYSLVLTPEKIISGGEDKTSTNLTPGTTWKFVWILVDHGDEGIEAQVLNVMNSDATYYVKVIK